MTQDIHRLTSPAFSGGALQAPPLDPYILDSWHRVVAEHGLDEGQPDRPHVLTAAEIRAQREPMEWLLRVAEPDIAALYGRVCDAGYVVMVSDTQGSCLSMIRNPLMDRELAKGGLELGRIYAEAIEGTSGIGIDAPEFQSALPRGAQRGHLHCGADRRSAGPAACRA